MQMYESYEPSVRDSILNSATVVWEPRAIATLVPSVPELVRFARCKALQFYLAEAELNGEISEFYALSIQAMLAIAESSEFAIDYLEMAEAIASSHYEISIIAEIRELCPPSPPHRGW